MFTACYVWEQQYAMYNESICHSCLHDLLRGICHMFVTINVKQKGYFVIVLWVDVTSDLHNSERFHEWHTVRQIYNFAGFGIYLNLLMYCFN